MQTQQLDIENITVDTRLQTRNSLCAATIDEYAESFDALPPVRVMQCMVGDEALLYLIDGFHRIEAAKRLGRTTMHCYLFLGSYDDACWEAAAANREHGLRRTNADKQRALALALSVKQDASLREIADHCGVSHMMVKRWVDDHSSVDESDVAVEAVQETAQVADEDTVETRMQSASNRIEVVAEKITAAQLAVAQMENDPLCRFANQSGAANDLKNALSAVRFGLPHMVCPMCNGNGCDQCDLYGWLTKSRSTLLPKQFRTANRF